MLGLGRVIKYEAREEVAREIWKQRRLKRKQSSGSNLNQLSPTNSSSNLNNQSFKTPDKDDKKQNSSLSSNPSWILRKSSAKNMSFKKLQESAQNSVNSTPSSSNSSSRRNSNATKDGASPPRAPSPYYQPPKLTSESMMLMFSGTNEETTISPSTNEVEDQQKKLLLLLRTQKEAQSKLTGFWSAIKSTSTRRESFSKILSSANLTSNFSIIDLMKAQNKNVDPLNANLKTFHKAQGEFRFFFFFFFCFFSLKN